METSVVRKRMRPTLFATLCLGLLLASCESGPPYQPVAVQWMDWPALVPRGTPFEVRLVVYAPCAWKAFEAAPHADQSAVTFTPYFGDVRQDILCAGQLRLIAGALDTVGLAPGLEASFIRSYEMRAASLTDGNVNVTDLPVRTFGEIKVADGAVESADRIAGGYVTTTVDTLGCLRLRPLGLYRPDTELVLENPADTAGLDGAFVRGTIYEVASPVCGETRVFHLLSRN